MSLILNAPVLVASCEGVAKELGPGGEPAAEVDVWFWGTWRRERREDSTGRTSIASGERPAGRFEMEGGGGVIFRAIGEFAILIGVMFLGYRN